MDWKRIAAVLKAIHDDERGGEEQASKMLTFALIALPLLALLIVFKDKVIEFFKDIYNRVVRDPDTDPGW
jgi:hypothetical protein